MSSNSEQPTLKQKYTRRFSEPFKRRCVAQLTAGEVSIAQGCRLWQVSRTSLYQWIYLYSDRIKGTHTVVEMESEGKRIERLLARLAELERIVGCKQMEIDLLQTTLDLASQEVGYDLKKKYATRSLSTGAVTPSGLTP
ncbi:transposase-like protein [Lewinella marina]|uniref:Transposase n=1 Tax=Neolewinella marina TaxID=438751 RepID=A0A2G0CAM2_9BACT|nr:transposase [Neolewinella marina]NJB87848.1 transposase-like protein [Neolewinella marina]PHK97041.1 transposase [Neolewinella marina]